MCPGCHVNKHVSLLFSEKPSPLPGVLRSGVQLTLGEPVTQGSPLFPLCLSISRNTSVGKDGKATEDH